MPDITLTTMPGLGVTWEDPVPLQLDYSFDVEALIIGRVIKEQNYIKKNNLKYKLSYFIHPVSQVYEFVVAGFGNAVIFRVGPIIHAGTISCQTIYQNSPKGTGKNMYKSIYAGRFDGDIGELVTRDCKRTEIGDLYL